MTHSTVLTGMSKVTWLPVYLWKCLASRTLKHLVRHFQHKQHFQDLHIEVAFDLQQHKLLRVAKDVLTLTH